ncbi:hypothetical protein BC834DRAFT_1012888 [Gloeopeniophorella convolvens]|nr:hypothetical protein BC834DRAFT_1012888 [Gloeopeniophorella convolvens]
MDRLPDEVLQIIFDEVDNPASLVVVCKRFHEFSQDPYVRAHYFLSRYGPVQALYWALGRGKLISEQVLDVLLSSGAHLSRYFVQIAVHHYFRSCCPFIKTPWVRTLSLATFSHLMKRACERFGPNINTNKGEDDGNVFRLFIKESKARTERRSLAMDVIAEVLDKGKFIPFCSKDPIMAQFPLALSIEPRLLPLAIANGFRMDSKYRDFVFRRILERSGEHDVEGITSNVRELCRLDASMFISRTVAAEVLMEAESNNTGYAALKALDREGGLRFPLATRSITTSSAAISLRYLWKDFPSQDTTARLVMLLTVFLGSPSAGPDTLHAELQRLNLVPVSEDDIIHILLNPFVENLSPILAYAAAHCGISDSSTLGPFLAEIVVRCMEIALKGNMLRSMCNSHPALKGAIIYAASTTYRLSLEDLPSSEREEECAAFEARLCRDPWALNAKNPLPGMDAHVGDWDGSVSSNSDEAELDDDGSSSDSDSPLVSGLPWFTIGGIGQETLTQVISHDELELRRRRSAPWLHNGAWSLLLPYLDNVLPVGKWVRDEFGSRHPVTATFMNHAVVNSCHVVCGRYMQWHDAPDPVPVTLHHFKMLARLGRAPDGLLINAIARGAEFHLTENDYLDNPNIEVKRETPSAESFISGSTHIQDPSPSIRLPSSSVTTSSAPRGCKRPRRSAAATVKSYAISESDDERATSSKWKLSRQRDEKRVVSSNLQLWIKHLSAIQKDETKKFNEKKRHLEQSNLSGAKLRVTRSAFLRQLITSLRDLRKESAERQRRLAPTNPHDEPNASDDDDEYQCRIRAPKRKKLTFH